MNNHFCVRCGTEINQGAIFCTKCGEKQNDAQPQQVQPPQQTYSPPQPTPGYQQNPYVAAPTRAKRKMLGVSIGAIALVIVLAVAFVVFIMPKMGSETSQDDYRKPPATVLQNVNVDAVEDEYYGSYAGTATITSNLESLENNDMPFKYAEYIKYGKTFSCTAEFDDYIEVFSEADTDEYIYDLLCEIVDGVAVDQFKHTGETINYTRSGAIYFLKNGSIYVIATEEYERPSGEYYVVEIRFDLKPVS